MKKEKVVLVQHQSKKYLTFFHTICYNINRGVMNMILKRDVVTCIILCFITCGIYWIVWFINLTDDIGYLSEDSELNGAKAFILTILTCGIYGFFWAYNIDKAIQKAQEKRNLPTTDNSIAFIILQFLSLNIVTCCIAQSEVNAMAEN